MNGFAQTPINVLTDTTLSPEARLTYSVITYFAWSAGRRRGDVDHGVQLPPLHQLCVQVGCSAASVKRYINELKRGRLVATKRQGNKGSIYYLFDTPANEEEYRRVGSRTTPHSASTAPASEVIADPTEGSRVTSHDESRPYKGLEGTKRDDLTVVRARAVPDDVLVDGQNLPMNAIIEVCNIDPASRHRYTEIQRCLTGGKRAGVGIRDLFWVECLRHAEAHNLWHVIDEMTPELYAALLAEGIHRKARIYRDAMPDGTDLTPTALHKWWLDIEKRRSNARPDVPSTLAQFEEIFNV